VDESPARRFFSIFNRNSKQKSDTVDLDADVGEPLTLSQPGDAVLVQVLLHSTLTPNNKPTNQQTNNRCRVVSIPSFTTISVTESVSCMTCTGKTKEAFWATTWVLYTRARARRTHTRVPGP
jgi:hypothetical protein